MILHSRDQIGAAIEEARDLYYKLVLIVGPLSSGKTALLRSAAASCEQQLVNLNRRLAELLLDLSKEQRPLRIQELSLDAFADADEVIFLDNSELLFDIDLHQDPLRLLQAVSRRRTVVATWAGVATASTLHYAEPGHPEYRAYTDPDVVVIALEQEHSDE